MITGTGVDANHLKYCRYSFIYIKFVQKFQANTKHGHKTLTKTFLDHLQYKHKIVYYFNWLNFFHQLVKSFFTG